MAADGQPLQPYGVRTVGSRIYIEQAGTPVSPFHDVPLHADDGREILNMVVEIPRWTNAKFEISRDETLNPIKQDTKDGEARFVKNIFPYKGYIWNYGALPKTWEDPTFADPDTKFQGDNDPLDACDISNTAAYPGEVKQVKVLGIFCLIDGEETDWKTIVIDINDPIATSLHGIQDVENSFPGLLAATRDWFRQYKVPDGKPANSFGLSGEFKDKDYAEHIIEECSQAWQRLISGEAQPGPISLTNTSITGSPGYIRASLLDIPEEADRPETPTDSHAHTWFFPARTHLRNEGQPTNK